MITIDDITNCFCASIHRVDDGHFFKDMLYVTVSTRSRKYKGNGYLIGRAIVYWDGFRNCVWLVWDPIKNEVHEVNPAHVELHESYLNTFPSYMEWLIKNYPIKLPKAKCGLRKINCLLRNFTIKYFIKYLHMRKNDIKISPSVIYVDEEKRLKKYTEFKKEKMKDLIAWAETKVDKKDVMELAEKIWITKYGEYRSNAEFFYGY